jgi:translocation and assembly module TamB
VQGKVDVPRALISMPEATEPVVGVSSDVRVVREGQDQLAILRAAKPWQIRADIGVSIGNQVIFQGFNSRIPLVGRLNLTQRGLDTAMNASGAIGVSQKVKIEAYGQSLDLNRAIARFNGPVSNPTLDVDANKSVQGSTVGVRVTGTASVPNIQIYNDAGLSEQEALNALVTGRINEGSSSLSNTAGFKSDVNNTIAAAGISMGLGGTRALTNQIGRTFGLSGLALDAQGTGDDTQVSLTGYITPDLFIRYGVGVFTPVNKLTLRYQVNKRLYLEASQALERSLDIFYNWRF